MSTYATCSDSVHAPRHAQLTVSSAAPAVPRRCAPAGLAPSRDPASVPGAGLVPAVPSRARRPSQVPVPGTGTGAGVTVSDPLDTFEQEAETAASRGRDHPLIQVQRKEIESNENSPTEEGAEVGGLGEIACDAIPNHLAVLMVKAVFYSFYPLALKHLQHYLDGQGTDFQEDVPDLFRRNPRIAARVGRQISDSGTTSGQLIGPTPADAPIRQVDFDSEDWRYSIGNVDEIDYDYDTAATNGNAEVRISIKDPYQWQPAEDRGTQCLHRAMQAEQANGAKEFMEVGEGTVLLLVGTAAAPANSDDVGR